MIGKLSLAIAVAGLVALIGCQGKRYPSRTQLLHGISIHSVYDGDKIIYGFATKDGTSVTETNDRTAKPPPKGVFWVFDEKDVLWVDGAKVSIPNGYKLIAIRDDGTVVPVETTQDELNCLARQHGVVTGVPQLEARLNAALHLSSSGPSSSSSATDGNKRD